MLVSKFGILAYEIDRYEDGEGDQRATDGLLGDVLQVLHEQTQDNLPATEELAEAVYDVINDKFNRQAQGYFETRGKSQ